MHPRAFTKAIVLAALATMTACDKQAARRPAADSTHLVPLTGPLAFLTSPIDTLVTLGAWVASHPADVVGDSVPAGAEGTHFCRAASTSITIGSQRFVRHALFNLPDPPAGEVVLDTAPLPERMCHLRAIWLVATDRDSTRLNLLADSMAHVLDGSLHTIPLEFGLQSRRRNDQRWAGAGTTLLVLTFPGRPAIVREVEDGDSTISKVTAPATAAELAIAAVALHSGLDPRDRYSRDRVGQDDDEDAERDLDLARADSALEWANLPALNVSLRPALTQLMNSDTGNVRTPAFDSALVRSATIVHDSTPALTPARRAAALLAMDLVLHHSVHLLGVDSGDAAAPMRRALEATGAAYEYEHIADGYYYRRDWLWSAYHQDSLGRAGHAAFISLLASGWGMSAGCEPNPAEKGDVASHAELALKRGDDDPQIHYYAGLADHDIVSLASGSFDEDYVNPKEYMARAPAARVRAIAHFRAALAGLKDQRMRRHAWRLATALMLGRSLETRFVCIMD
jgi:hypothetical protein